MPERLWRNLGATLDIAGFAGDHLQEAPGNIFPATSGKLYSLRLPRRTGLRTAPIFRRKRLQDLLRAWIYLSLFGTSPNDTSPAKI